MFLTTCILSGCDYLNQINGIGITTAQKSIRRVTTFRGFLSELGYKAN
jgi:5'-3' exonuclease